MLVGAVVVVVLVVEADMEGILSSGGSWAVRAVPGLLGQYMRASWRLLCLKVAVSTSWSLRLSSKTLCSGVLSLRLGAHSQECGVSRAEQFVQNQAIAGHGTFRHPGADRIALPSAHLAPMLLALFDV